MEKYKFTATLILVLIAIIVCCSMTSTGRAYAQEEETCNEYKRTDAELNRVYQRVLAEYKTQTVFISKLRAAQRAWILFRDAHVESLYPLQRSQYGSVYQTCRCTMLLEVVRERTEVLQKWITGNEEGDVCSGSIKIKS
jgi:uncharacterized protein YecT (DUF1311 family)